MESKYSHGVDVLTVSRVYPRALSRTEIEGLWRGAIQPFKCHVCGLYFTSRSELMRHIWKYHRK